MDKPKFSLEFEQPLHLLEEQLSSFRQSSEDCQVNISDEISSIEQKIENTKTDTYKRLTSWQKVQLARHPHRPYSLDYIHKLFEDFQELHGDRCFKDDQAIIGGTAVFDRQSVMIIAQQKGRSTKENIRHNFGSPNPEGYRKALRLMKLADKFGIPIISFIDTPGAYPGIEAEERHVGEAIAVNIREMSTFKVPIIGAIIGEGGSGGALGVGLADAVLIMENAYYSVITPEGCAAILWKDRVHAPDAAEALQLNASKLLELNVVDEIIEEPLGGAHVDPDVAARNLKKALSRHLKKVSAKKLPKLLEDRYNKYRALGEYQEVRA